MIKIKIIITFHIFYNDNNFAVKGYVVKYLWACNKNTVKFWVTFAIIIINLEVMIKMVSDNTGGCS